MTVHMLSPLARVLAHTLSFNHFPLLMSCAWMVALIYIYRLCIRILAKLEGGKVKEVRGAPAPPQHYDVDTTPRLTSSHLLKEVASKDIEAARNSWSALRWHDIKLRCGPNYKRNKKKAPTDSPLLPCVGVDIFQVDSKAYSDGQVDKGVLPQAVAAAAAEPTPRASGRGEPPPLPRYLVVGLHMPNYKGNQADGPGFRHCVYLAVPPGLRKQPDPAAVMLCDFLDGAGSGHAEKDCRFYDRWKIIVRTITLDKPPSFFLGKMMDAFNATPMLWRFFGKWGRCSRSGAVAFANLDFAAGGSMKNAAFAEGLRSGFDSVVYDISWVLEARADEEMPERLLGGVTLVRPDLLAAPRLLRGHDGSFNVSTGSSVGVGVGVGIHGGGTSSMGALTVGGDSGSGMGSPMGQDGVPVVLTTFLVARSKGDVDAAACCCPEDVICVTLQAEYIGLAAVKRGQFVNAAQKFDSPLQPMASFSLAGGCVAFRCGGGSGRWFRPIEATVDGRITRLRQLFTVVDVRGAADAKSELKISRIEVSQEE